MTPTGWRARREALARVRRRIIPYGRVGADAVGPALEWFKGRFADGPLAPYAYTGGLEENLLLPSAVGVPRPSAVVPESMAGGDLRDGGELCVVGFRALKDFYAPLLADNLGARSAIAPVRPSSISCRRVVPTSTRSGSRAPSTPPPSAPRSPRS